MAQRRGSPRGLASLPPGRWEGSRGGTIECQHVGVCPVPDVPEMEGDVQFVIGLQQEHLIVALICVETWLRAAPRPPPAPAGPRPPRIMHWLAVWWWAGGPWQEGGATGRGPWALLVEQRMLGEGAPASLGPGPGWSSHGTVKLSQGPVRSPKSELTRRRPRP